MRMERRHSPVLPLGVESVGRRSEAGAVDYGAGVAPGVGAVLIGADGKVRVQPHLHAFPGARRRRQLLIGQPLQVGVKFEAMGIGYGKSLSAVGVGTAVGMRPLAPWPPMKMFMQSLKQNEVMERRSAFINEIVEGGAHRRITLG